MQISPPKGLPSEVTILGIPYSITYYDNPSELHPDHCVSYNGFIDHGHSQIKIWGSGRPVESIITTILHEVLHGIMDRMSLDFSEEGETPDHHPKFTALANGITDTLIRNGLLNPALLGGDDGKNSKLQEGSGIRKKH